MNDQQTMLREALRDAVTLFACRCTDSTARLWFHRAQEALSHPAAAKDAEGSGEVVAWELHAIKFANGKKLTYEKPENLPSYLGARALVYADSTPPASQPQALGTWQPIETAPRGSGEDGPGNVNDPDYVEPPILLLCTQEGQRVGYYDWYYHPGYGRGADQHESPWRCAEGGQAYKPTHWMPLPPPPRINGLEVKL